MSKFDRNRIKDGWEKLCTNKQTDKQTNKQTDRHYKIMVTWPWTLNSTATTPHHNRFTALFPGPPGWASARRELLDFMAQEKINRGRHTDHPAGRHSIRTNQCPPPPSSNTVLPSEYITTLNTTSAEAAVQDSTRVHLWLDEVSEVAGRTWICWKPAPGCCRYCMYSVTKLVLSSACQGSSQRSWCEWSSPRELMASSLAATPLTAVVVALSTLSERLLCTLAPELCLERCCCCCHRPPTSSPS